jgi:hypothetical protein
MLNAAWLYAQHAKAATATRGTTAWSTSSVGSASTAAAAVAAAVAPALPAALANALPSFLFSGREPVHGSSAADDGGSCAADDASSDAAVGPAAAAQQPQQRWLARARGLYASAAVVGVAEAQRELGRCLAGLDEETWQGTCTRDAAAVAAARADAAAAVAAARAQAAAAAAAAAADDDDAAAAALASAAAPKPVGRSARKDATLLLEVAGVQGGDLQALRALAHWHSGYAATAPAGSGRNGAGRPRSRSLYAECAALGGYPDGLPCQVEAAAMELYWAASDVAAFFGLRLRPAEA